MCLIFEIYITFLTSQNMYTIKVVWFHKNFNNIEIFNAMKLGLGIQGTQIKPKVVTIHITKLN
jgi:hypothetical protein